MQGLPANRANFCSLALEKHKLLAVYRVRHVGNGADRKSGGRDVYPNLPTPGTTMHSH
jgi:hypothetical protein